MDYFLGVDGGGSKTLAVVTDEQGRILGRALSGCGNHQVQEELARRSIIEAAGGALAQAGLDHRQIRYAMFGLAGADREADFLVLRPMIADLGFPEHGIVCDTEIGLRAGTRQPDGVVAVCGSGTNCYGVNKRGESLQCGGFGYMFGDFGGGGELAVEVFRTVIRAWEGRERPTLLTEAVLQTLGYPSVERLFHDYLDRGAGAPGHLAKLLFQVAERDEAVRRILRRQGKELGLAAAAVIRKLGMGEDRFDLVLVGSVLTRADHRFVTPYIEEIVKRAAPDCSLRRLTMEPAAGAILLAMEKSGRPVGESVYERLDAGLSVKEELKP
ncbi:ATPase [Paenibacillus oralis]|uniref:ATPase n=1 Tax=Paenibacillus oralis TaxID=2490856 RepID=A0A3P3U162_9BACL|nr:BadF/BadG/BcrA/BcrD ATPase family protein [Paenibacillus oralis]RRJ63804.1 ATPase [Paenibacillus oralis]